MPTVQDPHRNVCEKYSESLIQNSHKRFFLYAFSLSFYLRFGEVSNLQKQRWYTDALGPSPGPTATSPVSCFPARAPPPTCTGCASQFQVWRGWGAQTARAQVRRQDSRPSPSPHPHSPQINNTRYHQLVSSHCANFNGLVNIFFFYVMFGHSFTLTEKSQKEYSAKRSHIASTQMIDS